MSIQRVETPARLSEGAPAKEAEFHHFLQGLVLVTTHIAQAVAFLTVTFATNMGWAAGYVLAVAIGLCVGRGLRQHRLYWTFQGAEWVALLVACIVVSAFV